MIWTFILLIIAGSVGVVAYPLFRTKLQNYVLPGTAMHDFSQADSWLSALSDLEDDLALGRMSKADYQQQKIFLQRGYLEWQNKSGNTKD
ncbi:MAG: hypothetical protein QGH79_11025 [SAR324 cluster bacterium]|jgi:hypothetical protein|nr:hypothetical protein [SAR324 cluster bacterium]MDP6743290.1 hypothetical protein [SAR324 cluster bacterium]